MLRLFSHVYGNNNIVAMTQVHGSRVVKVTKKGIRLSITNCDALITQDHDIYLSVSVADCIPLALYDPKTKSIGLVHAGWKGLRKKIIKKTIARMIKDFNCSPGNISAEIGPHICQKHYEIKDDVSKLFKDYPDALTIKSDKTYLDLAMVAKIQLIEVGIGLKKIKVSNRCTFEDKSLPSYRRGNLIRGKKYFLKIPDSP